MSLMCPYMFPNMSLYMSLMCPYMFPYKSLHVPNVSLYVSYVS
jgi:hypothetical protein